MPKSWLRAAFGLIGWVISCALVGGCCTPGEIKPQEVLVTVGESIQSHPVSVEVDLYGANSEDYDKWYNTSASEFFRNDELGNLARGKKLLKIMIFKPGALSPQVLYSPDDVQSTTNGDAEIWEGWRNRKATHLFVYAYVPTRAAGVEGENASDWHRLIFPLDHCRWRPESHRIEILVDAGGLSTLTPPEPEKK